MRKIIMRPTLAASAIIAAAGILAAGIALKPAIAGGEAVGMFGTVKCSSANPCQTYKNSIGAGVMGINTTSSYSGAAVVGQATQNAYGVSGFSTGNAGVNGYSGNNAGVSGSGNNAGSWGVYGYSNQGQAGVQGQGVNGYGVSAYSSNTDGVYTSSGSGNGLFSIAGSSGVAVYGLGGTGDAVVGAASWGGGVVGVRASNNGDNGTDGDGADMEGSYIGVIARNAAGLGYPLVAADTNGTDLMYVDNAGNLYYHGGLYHFMKTRDGHVTTAFGSESASPTIDDNGTAHLVNGVATVTLDPAFARSIDQHRAYQVMLTPDGDTRGLFVASKSPNGFVVREVQGGRSSIDFDYHIYAPTLGQAGQRMVEMTPSQAAAMMPHTAYRFQAQARPAPAKLLHH